MKRITVLIYSIFLCLPLLIAQKLAVTEVSHKLSKEAAKAQKNGNFSYAGIYWNEDKTQLYQIYAFVPKKSNTTMLEVVTVNENGKVASSEVMEFTDENLGKYRLVDHEAANYETRKELNGMEVAFLRNPVFAGVPKVIKGTFKDRYKSTAAGSIWAGFKFQKKEESELQEKFWRYVSFPLEDEVIQKNSYLLGDPASLVDLIKSGAGMRQYFAADGQAYIGGLKAVTGANIFMSGIMNMADGSWESVEDIDMGMKLSGGSFNAPYYLHSDGKISILLSSADQFKLLNLDSKGRKLNIQNMANPRSGGKHNALPSAAIYEVNNRAFVVTSTYETVGGKTVGMSISPLKGGIPESNWTFTNTDLASTLVRPAKQKVKIEKLKFLTLQSMRQLQNGDYLVNAYARYEQGGVHRVFVALQISKQGKLKATYLMDAIQAGKGQQFDYRYGDIPVTIKETKDGFFWVERAVLDGYQKGIHTSSSAWSAGIYDYTSYNSVRIDDTQALGQVVRVNTSSLSMSNAVTLEDQILGDIIGELSKNEHLTLFTGSGLLIIK